VQAKIKHPELKKIADHTEDGIIEPNEPE